MYRNNKTKPPEIAIERVDVIKQIQKNKERIKKWPKELKLEGQRFISRIRSLTKS